MRWSSGFAEVTMLIEQQSSADTLKYFWVSGNGLSIAERRALRILEMDAVAGTFLRRSRLGRWKIERGESAVRVGLCQPIHCNGPGMAITRTISKQV